MVKRKVINKLLKKKTEKRLARENKSLKGIVQGVGAVTRRPYPRFRPKMNKRFANRNRALRAKQGLNAMSPIHLPLPRAVGAYSVIKTTQIVTSPEPCMLFGTFKGPRNEFTETSWLTLCGVSNAPTKEDLTIGDASGSARFYEMTSLKSQGFAYAKMVPAAITVQLMNSNALQQTSGIVYCGRSAVVLNLMGNNRTWKSVFLDLVSYSAPRLCSAGKLALRGVQTNAIPNNMSVLSDFVPMADTVGENRVWTEAGYPTDFEGFGPIFYYNPNKVELQYLVTIEWRMRFDPNNPAYAGHSDHMPASESIWHQAISDAESAGHGCEDIVEAVVDTGLASGIAAMAV